MLLVKMMKVTTLLQYLYPPQKFSCQNHTNSKYEHGPKPPRHINKILPSTKNPDQRVYFILYFCQHLLLVWTQDHTNTTRCYNRFANVNMLEVGVLTGT